MDGDDQNPTSPAARADGPACATVLMAFAAITIAKVALFAALVMTGRMRPFVGDNAASHYLPIAERICVEGRFNGSDSRADSKVPIGYPAFLAVVRTLTPGRYYLAAVACVQLALGFAVAAMLYWLGRMVRRPAAGWLAGLGWLVFPPECVIGTWITAESLFTAMFMLSVVLLVRSLGRTTITGAVGAGAAMGAATLVRGTCLWMPVFLLPVWLHPKLHRGVLRGGGFAVGMICVVAPWTLRNAIVLNDPIVVAVGFGSVFRQGAETRFMTIDGKNRYYREQVEQAAKGWVVRPDVFKESDIDRWSLRLGLYSYQTRMRERPASIVPFAIYKLARLWYGTESGAWGPQLFLGACSLAVAPVGLWGLWRWRRRSPMAGLLMILVVGYFVVLHVVALPEYRYVHPVYPVIMFGAAMGLTTWRERRLRARRESLVSA